MVFDATSVEIDQHRWYATIRIERPNDPAVEIFICAEGEHSGLWMGDRADHEEHG
jgi:hypothetical protein